MLLSDPRPPKGRSISCFSRFYCFYAQTPSVTLHFFISFEVMVKATIQYQVGKTVCVSRRKLFSDIFAANISAKEQIKGKKETLAPERVLVSPRCIALRNAAHLSI